MKSFREQVKLFWKAFFQEEKKLRMMMDEFPEHHDELIADIRHLLNICLKDCPFETGKDPDGHYKLVLTPNGDPLTILYLRYIIERAPKILCRIWNFYYAKQCVDMDHCSITIQDHDIVQRDIILYPKVIEQRIHIDVYADILLRMDPEEASRTVYLLLDASIGEVYTMNYIGEIHLVKKKQDGGITLDLLNAYLHEVMSREGWMNRHDSLQVYSNYTIQPKQADFYLREDVYSGISTQIELINEMLQFGSYHVNYANSNGIQVGFLFYEHSQIAKDELFSLRESIDEQISNLFAEKHVAENIGAANGLYYTYLDYVVYDWERFLQMIVPVMEDVNTQLYGFQHMVIGEQPLYLMDNRPKGAG